MISFHQHVFLLLTLFVPNSHAFVMPSSSPSTLLLPPSISGSPDHVLSSLKLQAKGHDDEVSAKHASRRKFVSHSLAKAATIASGTSLSTVLSTRPALALSPSESLQPFEDGDYGFNVQVPSAWEKSIQKLSGRRKAVFFTPGDGSDKDTLLFIAYTPIRDDFTSLSSFGSVEQVAQTTILPKGQLMSEGPNTGTTSAMLSAVSKKNAYYFDYVSTPVVPTAASGAGDSMTTTLDPMHFRTIFTLLPNLSGTTPTAGLTLVTLTVQTTESKYAQYKGVFDQIIDSFAKI